MTLSTATLQTLVLAAGLAQLVVVIASVGVPWVLDWRRDLARLRPLNRQVFHVYAGYIFVSHIAFATLSLAAPGTLVDGSTLAAAVTGFLSLWWGARLLIQFAYFDRRDVPEGVGYVLAEVVLVTLFVGVTGVYAIATVHNLLGSG